MLPSPLGGRRVGVEGLLTKKRVSTGGVQNFEKPWGMVASEGNALDLPLAVGCVGKPQ